MTMVFVIRVFLSHLTLLSLLFPFDFSLREVGEPTLTDTHVIIIDGRTSRVRHPRLDPSSSSSTATDAIFIDSRTSRIRHPRPDPSSLSTATAAIFINSRTSGVCHPRPGLSSSSSTATAAIPFHRSPDLELVPVCHAKDQTIRPAGTKRVGSGGEPRRERRPASARAGGSRPIPTRVPHPPHVPRRRRPCR